MTTRIDSRLRSWEQGTEDVPVTAANIDVGRWGYRNFNVRSVAELAQGVVSETSRLRRKSVAITNRELAGGYIRARIDLSSARHASPNAFIGSASAERASSRICSTVRLRAKYCSVMWRRRCSASARTGCEARRRIRLISA